ncbi:MAG: FCSD flavin-binding domain-containing protein [Burkholderiales bacterium]
MQRREFLRAGALAAMAGLAGCAGMPGSGTRARVVVVGGGYGGATAAKYIRLFDPSIEVVLVEPNEAFISCPISNLVLGGFKTLADITTPYTGLASNHGVRIVRDMATAIDADRKQVRLARGETLSYDRVIVGPGIEFIAGSIPAMETPAGQARVMHAWKAGPQTVALRRQLEEMPDGGVYILAVPQAPYRCPPGPYERACQVAAYFKARKPRSKVLVLDANANVTSKGPLFRKAWAELYNGMVEYRGNSKAVDVDLRTGTVKLELDDVKGDVLNVVPPMKCGKIADAFITANNRWCEVDWITYESKVAKGVHLLGDSTLSAPVMPKSGHMANAHGKACAAAVVALLNGEAPNPSPTLTNTCYSFVSDSQVVHVASVHKYDAAARTMKTVPGSGGVSSAMNELEAGYALNWARNIWADTLG